MFGLFIEVLVALSNLGVIPTILIMILVLAFFIAMFLPFDGKRMYMVSVDFVRYVFSVKHFSKSFKKTSSNLSDFLPFKGFEDQYIVYDNYFAGVLEISPREFRLLSEFKQNQFIDAYFGRVLRSITGHTKASIIKIDRKLVFTDYVNQEEAKRKELYALFEKNELTKTELASREKVINDRIRTYQELSGDNYVKKPFYYLVVYDENKNVINDIMTGAIEAFSEMSMNTHILNKKELVVFMKYNYTDKFEDKDIDVLEESEYYNWATPNDVQFTPSKVIVDGEDCFTFTVKQFPLSVINAYGYKLFNIPDTKVTMNIEPYERSRAVHMLDRSLQELSSQSEQSYKASALIDKQTHIKTLVGLLRMLQNDNEVLFKVTLHFTVYNRTKNKRKDIRKTITKIIAEEGFDVADNYCRQLSAMVATNVSRYDPMVNTFGRAIHSGSVAASFPFVLATAMDESGCILGIENSYPVIIDFFKRNEERVNSNMVIMGKSGSGKSYSVKTLLTNLSAENSKIFILDPENEYQFLANNMGGRLIDVGTASDGRINPFHIITTLDADENGQKAKINNYAVHLQFLEEFFRVALDDISGDALEYLNNLIVELYNSKNINSRTNLAALGPKDYPIFDDLIALIDEKLSEATVDYDVTQLRILHNYISKFAGEGRNANLWNGESALSVKENFTVFNFQSLLANKNGVIANAQMLLVLKWLDNEIIKNRDFNLKHHTNRKIVVAIDEAHVFIDPKYPVALDFMYQLAKRIRKYNGMQIVITQNIKDFVGSDDIIRKSTAIINACQYSFIFSLAPNDMGDLCTLYEKAGQINEVEQDQIVNNPRGNAFIITSPTSRTNIQIVASSNTKKLFGE